MSKLRILIVDDEAKQRELLHGFLKKRGYAVTDASSGEDALAKAERTFFEIALLDISMPGISGLELLASLKEANPDLQAIMISAHGTFDTALDAMKKGAFDFLAKPVDLERLLTLIEKAGERHWLLAENRFLKDELGAAHATTGIVAESALMKNILSVVARVAKSDATVLIRGESGTGKELVARALHDGSACAAGNFIAVNCAALPETLLEAELFGAEKGAYTGAVARRLGRFELAAGGTIFLDEIGDIPHSIQAKLLRVLESRTFERLGSGGADAIETDARVVAATHRDLETLIADGTFRSDLYYRLNVVTIEMPSLRERPVDIMPLVELFMDRLGAGREPALRGITPAAKDRLLAYGWPGNVRELFNAVQRACVLTRGDVLDVGDFPLVDRVSESSAVDDAAYAPTMSLSDVEQEHIQCALKHHGGSLQKTSETLGIHRNTLRLKMKEYGIEKPE